MRRLLLICRNAIALGWLALSTCAASDRAAEVQAEEWQIREIVPPLEWPQSHFGWFWVGGVVLLGLLGGAVCWRRWHASVNVGSPEKSTPDLALRALDELLASNHSESGEIKVCYQQVTDILRHYLDDQFGIRAPELTTREFLALRDTEIKLPPNQRQFLEALLTHCDLVKFAEHQPTPEDVQNVFACCRSFVQETRYAV